MQNQQYEISFIEGIQEDFLDANITEIQLMNIKSKMDIIAQSPMTKTERVKGVNTPYLRKIRFGDYRLFIYVNESISVIYCLAFLPRKKCYDKVSLNKVLTLVKNIME